MEKLIDLLNEYEQLNMCRKFDSFELHTFENSSWVDRLLEDTVISARYGFIKWLVENDKIGREKVKEKSDRIPLLLDKVWDIYNCGVLKSVLMLLSISDTPIEFLCEILKDE